MKGKKRIFPKCELISWAIFLSSSPVAPVVKTIPSSLKNLPYEILKKGYQKENAVFSDIFSFLSGFFKEYKRIIAPKKIDDDELTRTIQKISKLIIKFQIQSI